MHVLSVIAHPNANSFSHQVLKAFAAGAIAAGHTHEAADLYRENFDPVMSMRDMEQFDGAPMTADVLAEQARVDRADALCLIYPIWWYGMPAMMKGWLDRVWSAGWAYEWKHDPEGSLLRQRPLTLLLPTGASERQITEFGCEDRLDHVWRHGVFGYCGVDPIRIHFLLDSAFDKGAHATHLETAYAAGQQVAEVAGYDVPNRGGRSR
ncbi:MAG: NAD(P)H-dependent oxidoreductase [Hyphomicrobiales bacterium]